MSPSPATRDFFAARAAGWETRFPDDEPAFAAAIAELAPPWGGLALDAACGTGRALPILRRAVGPDGMVIGVDLTPEMLHEATRLGRSATGRPDPTATSQPDPTAAQLVLGDVNQLPLPDRSIDCVIGAGLLPHLEDPAVGMTELARVTRAGGRLALFHPIGRVALAARHGHQPDPDDIRAEPAVRALLTRTGWKVDLVDDGPDRYLVVATRT